MRRHDDPLAKEAGLTAAGERRQRQGSSPRRARRPRLRRSTAGLLAALLALLCFAGPAFGHAVAQGDKGYIQEVSGARPVAFAYLGAKHMVTGYDHVLFLLGVIFFLYRMRDIALYVSLFAVGHSTTMLAGVFFEFGIDSHLIDAIIGFSIVYKALDNMGAYQRWFGVQPDTKLATLIFGFCHGFGLSSKILDYEISPDGLLANLLAFNLGVEIGQLLALGAILIAMGYWRRTAGFLRHAYSVNAAMMSAGFMLMGYQLTGYLVT
ncbi:MAG: HupE/UreJ family protein [Acidobacteria bacterium]|nr:MAG: HupE/UreJ family protein [Acidobacteriota bacterium]REK08543.1 MAG: HupE/UreJ family protein [Acidobacteriota bacterium]